MRLFDLLPKFIRKMLVRREYWMVKAQLGLLQDEWIPNTRKQLEKNQKEDKDDVKLEALYQNYLDLEILLADNLEDLKGQMKYLGLETE